MVILAHLDVAKRLGFVGVSHTHREAPKDRTPDVSRTVVPKLQTAVRFWTAGSIYFDPKEV